ncbi:MAG: histidine kinase, partial [Owenweeksia sp.]
WTLSDSVVVPYKPGHELLKGRLNDIGCGSDRIFIASADKGLIVVQEDSIWHIGRREGLPSNKITALTVSGSTVWCGTPVGLSRVDMLPGGATRFTIENFNTLDGLVSSSITKVAVADSQVFVGTEKGLSVLYLNRWEPVDEPPYLHINAVLAGDSIPVQSGVVLPYDQGRLSFYFTGISFASQGRIRYRYRLKGLEEEWQTTTLQTVRYDYLPAGDYTLQLQAQGRNGVWNKEPVLFSFSVTPPYWMRWWFIGLMVLFGTGLIVLISAWVILVQKRRNRLKLRMIRSEQMALQAQMNPHFMFNALNSIQAFSMRNEKRKAARYLSDFSGLIRKSLTNSRYSLIRLEEEIEVLNLYVNLENMRLENTLDFELNIDPQLAPEELKIPPMLLQPLLENAIWHGLSPMVNEKRELKLTFKWISDERSVACIVEDNGIGRKKAAELKQGSARKHQSLGLQNISDRLHYLNSYYGPIFTFTLTDLVNDEGEPQGTRAELYIRITKNYR